MIGTLYFAPIRIQHEFISKLTIVIEWGKPPNMRNAALFVIAVIMAIASGAFADPEIVLAIRYLQPEGTSHSHLYLYREDGKFLRQLTKDNSGQDVAPIFDQTGETIVFTREKPHKVIEY